MKTIMIRRKKLGFAIKHVCEMSQEGLTWVRSDKELPEADLYIRWGCTANIPCKNVLNKAAGIHTVGDKSGFRSLLMDEAPHLIPTTFFHIDEVDEADYPLVVRPQRHAQGRKLYLARNKVQLTNAIRRCGQGWYASHYIPKVAEYRVFVLQGRAVWVAKKNPANPDDVAWNVAKGGSFVNVGWSSWPLRLVKEAIECMSYTGLDFGGVDVMVDEEGRNYILEVNSAPSQTSPYRQSCTAKAFDYIIKREDKKLIPLVEERGGYRKFIHPGVDENAKMVSV